MRVVVPIWQGRVSPVLDVAQRMLVAEIDAAGVRSREELRLANEATAKVRQVAESHADVVLCSGVSADLARELSALGVLLVPHLCGSVEEVLEAFRTNRLGDRSLAMPGCQHRHDHGEPLDRQPSEPGQSERRTAEGR